MSTKLWTIFRNAFIIITSKIQLSIAEKELTTTNNITKEQLIGLATLLTALNVT